MAKKILSLIIVLAMLVSVLPVPGVSAEVSDETLTKHTHSDAHSCSAQCAGGTITWTAWDKTDSLPTESGHYYLTADVQMTTTQDTAAGKDITICLNGYNIRSASGKRIGYVYGKLTVADCTAYEKDGKYISGSVVGGNTADGAVLSVRRDGTLVLEGGRLTGGKTTGTAAGGAVYTQKGTSAGAGGLFYMYGGEISGNEAHNGGAVCVGGADSGCTPAAFYMYGGTITGNTGRNRGGGVYVVNRSVMEVHGGTITGNTATDKAAAVYMEGGSSKLTVSGSVKLDEVLFVHKDNAGLKVNGLTEGTEIIMTTTVEEGAAADITKTVSLASGGSQTSWNTHWITANGESVSMVEGAFVFGHYHGTTAYEAWTGGDTHTTLPSGGKNYYLANDIVRKTDGGTVSIGSSATQHLCLNGFTITHRNPANRLYNITGNFFLEDCTAYTDSQGNYISGGVTYGSASPSTRTYGNCFSVQRGGTMTMTGGQIYGFFSELAASQDSVPVYVQGAQTTAKAVFNMQGGQIHSNTSKANGAAIRLTKASSNAATENFSEINISGGKIWGNTTTTNGGAVAVTGDVLNITGGTITGNTAACGAVYVAGEARLTVAGNVTIHENNGGNLYLAGDRVLTVGELTGGKIGIGAAQTDRIVSNAVTAEEWAYFESDNSEVPLNHHEDCLYLGVVVTHIHGLDGKEGDLAWSKWSATDSLPTAAGNYYLENDVQLTATVTIAADVKLCLNGKTVTAAAGKRVLGMNSGAVVTITDCCETCGTITGGSNKYGAVVNVNRGATLNLYNGKLTGNTSPEEGGAVYMQGGNAETKGGAFYMYGGEISGNSAKRGGAVTMASSASSDMAAIFHFYGGKLENNTATSGGAVYSYENNSLKLAGGTITGNTATTAAGGIYVHAQTAQLQVEGAPVVKNNLLGTINNNIYLLGDAVITDTGLQTGAELWLSAEKTQRAVSGALLSQEAGGYFHSDSNYRVVEVLENQVYLNISGEHPHCLCAGQSTGCQHEQVKWQAWESTTSLPTVPGNYYLLADVTLAEQTVLEENANVQLCLNGKTVKAPAGKRHISITKNATLSLTDCGKTGLLTGGNRTFGASINVNRMGTFNLFGGTISGNKAETAEGLGGAIYMQGGNDTEAGGVLNIYGGTISGNTAYSGGAIYVAAGTVADAKQSQVNIYGGTISGNQAVGIQTTDAEGKVTLKGANGAAIYVGQYGVLTMQGGTISENSGLNYGGTIYLNAATASFTGGKITKNMNQKDGGGFYAVAGSTVQVGGDILISENRAESGGGGGFGASGKSRITMTGGTVSNNYAVQGGGAIIQSGASFTMTGGTFSGNEAKAYGGAIYVNAPNADGTVTTMYLSGGNITGNKSGNAAGGVYCYKGYLEMTGGTVSKNETANFGCGLYFMRANGKVTGGTITGNVSGKDGTGIYCYAGAVEIGGSVKITNNTSLKGAGGGLGFTKECKAVLSGGTITGNTAGNAGGIIVQGQAHLTMTGGYVGSNTTKANGGGIFVHKSSADLLGGTVEGNTAGKTGAGVYCNDSTTKFGGTVITGNKSTGNGGGVYVNKGTATFTGGSFLENSSDRYGGAMYFYNAQVTGKDILVSGNFAKLGSGAIHGYNGKLTLENATFSENSTDSAAGAVCVTKFCQLTMSDCLVEKNTANNGAGVLIQNWAEATLNNLTIRENVSTDGSGLYVFSDVVVTVNGGEISGNIAKTKVNSAGKTVGGIAAGVQLHTNTRTQTGKSTLYLNGTVIKDNVAERDGGGIYVDMQMHLYMDGCTVENNQAGGSGAGIYQQSGTRLSVKNTTITGNVGGGTGSAIYAGSDLILDGGTISGNKTTDGTAVYVAPANFDGHSYANAVVKLGGDLVICDNEGTMEGDLYFDEGVAATGTENGFGEKTNIKIQLHSGLLTDSLLAAYNYEGGDGIYTITYGDRSLTEPEYVAPEEPEQIPDATTTTTEPSETAPAEQAEDDTMLYLAIGGVIAVILLAAVVLVIVKKKKAGKATQE